MTDTTTCPRTRAAYQKIKPVLDKLPAELNAKLTDVAIKVCTAEHGVSAASSVTQFATRQPRIR